MCWQVAEIVYTEIVRVLRGSLAGMLSTEGKDLGPKILLLQI
jgi:hypothetical protein